MGYGKIVILNYKHKFKRLALSLCLIPLLCFGGSKASTDDVDVVEACVNASRLPWTATKREQIASCLGWMPQPGKGLCEGSYRGASALDEDSDKQENTKDVIDVRADEVKLAKAGRSELSGHVSVVYDERVLLAKTAYIHRDPTTSRVTEIELLDNVVYREPGRMMHASRVQLSPHHKTGEIHNVLYRFEHQYMYASLPAFGKADLVKRFDNRDLILKSATYTTCSPKDKAWMLKADEIRLYESAGRGEARDAVITLHDVPVAYAPYLSFPISKERKSGFLMPTSGYSNIGGGDLSFPYYWNIAPNYDATLVPHVYTRRGVMMEGDTRFMTEHSKGVVGGAFLSSDKAFKNYIAAHEVSYPSLRNLSDNRWSLFARGNVDFTNRLRLNVNYQKVSDDYFLQDFNNNMTVMTESQLLKEASVRYTGEHWYARGMVQSYQTLNPINQSPVKFIYQRLPQIQVRGQYDELPMNLKFWVRSQYDQFDWPVNDPLAVEGPRFHVNPSLSVDFRKPWGYITPEVQLIENYYDLRPQNKSYKQSINHTIPRYSTDAGLTFERDIKIEGVGYKQTFEPRLFYLYVPYQNQSNYPAFDSAYMIFRYEQLFRQNRFSGFDRISDGNQLAYAFRTRFLSDNTGHEKASFSVGQLGYFSKRRVQLCQSPDGQCEDNSRMLGFTSPTASFSPVAAVLSYYPSDVLKLSAGWSFDPSLSATNNADFNVKYEPEKNHIIRILYSYLVAANLIQDLNGQENLAAEHQITLAYAWPFTERWSSVGVFSYNISERYDMVSFLGLQYESCCWAVRAFAGRAFNSLTLDRDGSQYNNSVYIQVLLKGFGAVSSNDPASTLRTYLPTYVDIFHHS